MMMITLMITVIDDDDGKSAREAGRVCMVRARVGIWV